MADRGGFDRGFGGGGRGDRGRGDRGRGDRGRGDRGRGRSRGRGRGEKDEEKWVPLTKLGRLVQQVGHKTAPGGKVFSCHGELRSVVQPSLGCSVNSHAFTLPSACSPSLHVSALAGVPLRKCRLDSGGGITHHSQDSFTCHSFGNPPGKVRKPQDIYLVLMLY